MSQRDRYTKTIATLHLMSVEGADCNGRVQGNEQTVATVVVEHCDKSPTRIPLRIGDSIVIEYAPEVEAPDGKSLVRAAWAVLLDILGFKKV